jgi:anti-anti-sigma factor
MALAISTERDDARAVVRLEGDFDLHSAASVRATVQELLDDGVAAVHVDLAGVDFLDSSGLGTLVGLQKHSNRVGIPMSLGGLTPTLQKIFDVTQLRGAFTIEGDESPTDEPD